MITFLCLLTILCFYTSGAFSGMLICDEQSGYKLDIRDIFFAVFGFLLGLIFLVVLLDRVHG
jgi:hypothetical protein